MKNTLFLQSWLFCVCFLMSLLSSCGYDDEELVGRVDDLENRVAKLEELCSQMNNDITSLQTLISAVEERDYITEVVEIKENEKVIGYTIKFAQHNPITIYHGKNGTDGVDGYVPAISVQKDKDGIYYWTLDGEWLTDKDGNKIKAVGTDGKDGADGEDGKDGQDGEDGNNGHNGSNGRDGITPKLKIENDTWYVSYDNGANWESLGSATGGGSEETCSCPITDINTQADNKITFTLKDGNSFDVPYHKELTITFTDITDATIEVEAGTTIEITYELSYKENVKVSAIGEGVRTDIKDGKLLITTDKDFTEGKVLVHATDGNNVATEELKVNVLVITYIEYKAKNKLEPDEYYFQDYYPNLEYLPNKSIYDEATQEGKMAIKGSITMFEGVALGTNSNRDLISIKIPEGVAEIGNSAFGSCSSLISVSFPSTLNKIGYGAFDNTSLGGDENGNLIIPEGTEVIDQNAFKCDNGDSKPTYTRVTLPSTIKSIGSMAFRGSMNNDIEVYCYAEEIPTLSVLSNGTINKTKKSFTDKSNIYVPSTVLDKYKSNEQWKVYTIESIKSE